MFGRDPDRLSRKDLQAALDSARRAVHDMDELARTRGERIRQLERDLLRAQDKLTDWERWGATKTSELAAWRRHVCPVAEPTVVDLHRVVDEGEVVQGVLVDDPYVEEQPAVIFDTLRKPGDPDPQWMHSGVTQSWDKETLRTLAAAGEVLRGERR